MNVIAAVSDKRLDPFVQTIYEKQKRKPIHADSVSNFGRNANTIFSLTKYTHGKELNNTNQKRFANSKGED